MTDHPVSEAIERLAGLVEQFTSAQQAMERAAQIIAPEIRAAIEAAGAAGAAEREVIAAVE
ncbi:hypothetical protein, partial [Nocardia farcinica]|uniref:hypothetical protein n=1 Tax=Nocardia farcinica TaxID=37329 RepID=UPI00114560E4